MNEIYWLTRFDSFNTVFTIITILSGIAFVISLFGYIGNKYDAIEYDSSNSKQYMNFFKSFLKYASVFLLFGVLGLVFLPTTKQALLIWGVGGSIDYLKQNPTARQLPDKCIIALDKWVDSLANDSIEETRKKK